MKFILLLSFITISFSLIVFPFKIRINDAKTYFSPINQTKIPILKYMYHILNDKEFVSRIEVGEPRQNVELLLNEDESYLTINLHTTSPYPYYYNLSKSYNEFKVNDKECGLRVKDSVSIKELLHVKTGFYTNLDDFLKSKDEITHEFIIIFSKHLPTLKKIVLYKYWDSNAVCIGLQYNTRYNKDHGIYEPFMRVMKDQGQLEKHVHFYHFFEDYIPNLYTTEDPNNKIYDGLMTFGKYPHELMPNKFDVKKLYWADTFKTYSKIFDYEHLLWGVKFNEVYIDYGNNKKKSFEFLRGVFDFNVEYIFPPYEYYETIKNFFRPLRKICFIDSNDRLFKQDPNIYRMVYCDYEEFGKKYLKTFPNLVFKLDNFDEEFVFTYEDLFKPIYDNKYYLFVLFMRKMRASDILKDPPSWILGRMFLQKYQFVFDALNKKVGYYKVTQTESETDTDTETDEITDDNTDKTDNTEKETDKHSDNDKTDDEDKNKEGKKESI